jgi:hypothetical protein
VTKTFRGSFAVGVSLAAVLLATPTPVAAYLIDPNDWYGNSAIADGNLTMCFEASSPVYDWRATIVAGGQKWSQAIQLTWTSTGACDAGDQSNIQVFWTRGSTLDYRCPSQPNDGRTPVWAWAQEVGGSGYYTRKIHFNEDCGAGAFYWRQSLLSSNGTQDVESLALHEYGHVLGLDHPPADGISQIMDNQGFGGKRCGLSQDDANGIRARYPGLTPTNTVFPTNMSCVTY